VLCNGITLLQWHNVALGKLKDLVAQIQQMDNRESIANEEMHNRMRENGDEEECMYDATKLFKKKIPNNFIFSPKMIIEKNIELEIETKNSAEYEKKKAELALKTKISLSKPAAPSSVIAKKIFKQKNETDNYNSNNKINSREENEEEEEIKREKIQFSNIDSQTRQSTEINSGIFLIFYFISCQF
jgi:hypothetical protein